MPRFDIGAARSANINALIDQKFRDPISGSTSHRAYACDVAAVPAEIRARRSGWRRMRVKSQAIEARGIASLHLAAEGDDAGTVFRAGQFIAVRVKMANGDLAVRNYSISSAPVHPGTLRISVKSIGAVSAMLNGPSMIGADIDIKGPFGTFAPRDPLRHLVMLAGGSGITPFISLLNELAATATARPVTLFYGVRSVEDHAFREELAAAERANPGIRVLTYLSDPLPTPAPPGFIAGIVSVSEIARHVALDSAEFMLCGPPPMVAALSEQLIEAGVERRHIIAEALGPAALPPAPATPQMVRLARSGVSFEWTADRGSLLEQIEGLGSVAPSGCRAGQCGSCKVVLRGGACELPEASGLLEPDECLICVARPLSAIELDL